MKENVLIFIDFTKKLFRRRDMVWAMALRELKALYVGSFFGFFWAVMNPLAQLLIYGVVFGVFFRSKPDPVYNTKSFFLFLLAGLVPWQFFTECVSATTNSILANGNLVKKAVGFPSEVLPIVTVTRGIISHLIGLAILVAIILVLGRHLAVSSLLVFVYLFFAAVFTVGLGWILSSVNVFLRDVNQVVGLALMGMFFFTPIFYSPTRVPGNFLVILKLNPMFHVVEAYRYLLLAGRVPDPTGLVYLAVASFATLGLGGLVFSRLKPDFAEVL